MAKSETGYINYYRCECGEEWTDEWSCACDDRCPTCNTSISPYASETQDGREIDWTAVKDAEAALGNCQEGGQDRENYSDDQDRESYSA